MNYDNSRSCSGTTDCDFCLEGKAQKFYAYSETTAFKLCYKCWIARKSNLSDEITREQYQVYLVEERL